MTILRVGSNQAYAEGWAAAFGNKKKKPTKKAATGKTKKAAKAKVKTKAKTATKKKKKAKK